MSLQKKSDWEKRFDEKWTHQASVMFERENIKDFIKEAIDTAVSKREKEIAEEVEKKRTSDSGCAACCPDHIDSKCNYCGKFLKGTSIEH